MAGIFHFELSQSGFLQYILGARLLIPEDTWKDQTLFLCQIKQDALKRTMFPVGDLKKEVVKKIATEAGLQKIVQRREVSVYERVIYHPPSFI